MNKSAHILDSKEPLGTSDLTLRPQRLEDFVGQQQARKNLKVFIEAARSRNEAIDHVLFYGPPGLGKTTLSQIMARVGFRATSGPVIVRSGDLAALLTNLQPYDVLFIDEIHRLNPAVEEILYPAMEDFKLDLMIGEGPAARSVQIDLPPFTLIGATTRSGLISSPLRDRFGIPIRLVFYEPKELQDVLLRGATALQVSISEEGALEIARRSRGTPRIALRLLKRIRDFVLVEGGSVITAEGADRALSHLEVDGYGLDAMDHRYLKHILAHFDGGPVGLETLAAALAEQKDTLEDVIEPYLLQQGYIQRTPRGRMLTPRVYEIFGLKVPNLHQPPLVEENDA